MIPAYCGDPSSSANKNGGLLRVTSVGYGAWAGNMCATPTSKFCLSLPQRPATMKRAIWRTDCGQQIAAFSPGTAFGRLRCHSEWSEESRSAKKDLRGSTSPSAPRTDKLDASFSIEAVKKSMHCHPERSEGSQQLPFFNHLRTTAGMLRFAQHDRF